ncbi:hypothetical protein M406DRAFT_267478 [Cryphonectria parasitica EP155]|uniref:GST N-terminal domain-containing protein n=1 Tax=Cryphonectria parasitica (strain ATCC 38755 / EP155) TaxID=660469 RepID=A0A9P4XUC2_CRYP1|nr:uncharacterized protein M406DRAFT_267478 [Cryphonectria parasitica EP155]KAF3761048.1 hypothetical protein M406DRAFT_267478 [Cryphonectria parasitica EP155]
MSSEHPIILYRYKFSPYAKRIEWYLQLRGIPYKQTEQPNMMPRPDVAALGIKYRRIPILAIGRDVYLDTRLILQKLETLPAPAPKLGAAAGDHRAIERLLEALMVDAGPFLWAATLIPPQMPLFKDKAWLKDRSDFVGGRNFGAAPAEARAEAVANLRGVFELLETALLVDGREWLLKTDGPSLADIEAVWPLHWLWGMRVALPPDQLSERQFPRVFAWIERFDKAVSAAAARLGKVPTIAGAEATQAILSSPFLDEDGQVQGGDPIVQALGLSKGDRVVVFPTDSGMTHKDSGVLIGLDEKEVVFETRAEVQGSPAIRVHAPRHGFRIAKEGQAARL